MIIVCSPFKTDLTASVLVCQLICFWHLFVPVVFVFPRCVDISRHCVFPVLCAVTMVSVLNPMSPLLDDSSLYEDI